jgi:hypothetical protein
MANPATESTGYTPATYGRTIAGLDENRIDAALGLRAGREDRPMSSASRRSAAAFSSASSRRSA